MTLLRRPLPWREPPIVFQILVLLLAGLVVAQLVTLLLTMVFPPAPATQHSFGEVVEALRGQRGRLARSEQSGPPVVAGPGWFTSDESRHQLASMLGARDQDVRLAFYAPLPFAGITAPPSRPEVPIRTLARPVAWQVWPEPLRPVPTMPARLIPASLIMMEGPGNSSGGGMQGGGMSSGGMPGGGFPGGGAPGGGFGGRGGQGAGFHRGGDTRRGQSGDRDGSAGDALRQDAGRSGHAASPSDLDHQPVGPYGHRDDNDGDPAAARGYPGNMGPADARGLRTPTDGFGASRADETPTLDSALQPVPAPTITEPAPSAATTSGRHDARPAERTVTPSPPASDVATAPPPPASRAPLGSRTQPLSGPRAIAIAPLPRALFGLAPAPFVEGDFVAALRLPDGRWAVVQPAAEGFPNAWQRRVILWFVIAFALVAPVGWLFARHIVRPLARFTAAAEQLGRDPSAALVALEGPAEIGRAARAFNVMQNRLRSFVDDRTAMVGAISHDLRTPLTRLRFRIEEVDDDGIRDGMNEEVAEMEAMISSVLSFIRDASTPNVRERLDLGLLMDDVVQDAAMIGSDVTVEQTTSAPVEVDVLGMRRLLANLVENAVKYGQRARIRLAVDDNAAIAEIIDDGPGIPEDELERAFEPFYRASNAVASGKNGTGLGLAVCRSIARAHGGDVRLLRSADGFSAELRLPLAYDTSRIAA